MKDNVIKIETINNQITATTTTTKREKRNTTTKEKKDIQKTKQ